MSYTGGNNREHLEWVWDRSTGTRATDSRATVHGGGSDISLSFAAHSCIHVSIPVCTHSYPWHLHVIYACVESLLCNLGLNTWA